jgi:hypothetical protein
VPPPARSWGRCRRAEQPRRTAAGAVHPPEQPGRPDQGAFRPGGCR